MPDWSITHAAVVVRHIWLTGDNVLQRPRAGATPTLSITKVTPVVHVEISTVNPPRQLNQSHDLILDSILHAAQLSTSGWVQLDMEARPSHRDYYLQLVRDIRLALPRNIKLSVTALTWWCRSSHWLKQLDADEVVPMFFRMGKESVNIRQVIQQQPSKLDLRCRTGVAGFATHEPFTSEVMTRYHKVYWFDMRGWRKHN